MADVRCGACGHWQTEHRDGHGACCGDDEAAMGGCECLEFTTHNPYAEEYRQANRARPWRHVGEPVSIDGVPFGRTYHDGDYYIATDPLAPGDVDLAAENERLLAAVRAYREQTEGGDR